MLSHLHHSTKSRVVIAEQDDLIVGLSQMCSSYINAAVLIDLAKCALDWCAVTVASSNRPGCVPAIVFPNGPSHSTRSPTVRIFCGTSRPSLWLIKRCICLGLTSSFWGTSGKNFWSLLAVTCLWISAMLSFFVFYRSMKNNLRLRGFGMLECNRSYACENCI